VVLTADERVRAIAEFGFTDRQARFLELVMRHVGVCVPRQYARFAGIAHGGRKCNAFFDRLVRRGYAVPCDCIHNRARLFHVRHRPLYHAIGEPESRHRRPVSARRAVERLMMLDAVLELPHLNWLTTGAEKLRLVTTAGASTTAPERTDGPTDRAPNRLAEPFDVQFPIGLQPDGRAVFLYLATVPWTSEFRVFLQAHARLFIAVPSWALRVVFPRPLDRAYDDYQKVVREELETSLHRFTISELKSYFTYRREATDGEVHPFKEARRDSRSCIDAG
jgi:hypothetical protein